MSTKLYPLPLGFDNSTNKVVIGKNQAATWEAIGFAEEGRPGVLKILQINVSDGTNLKATINLDVTDLTSLNLTSSKTLKFREISVCQDGVEKKMLVIATEPY